MFPQNNSFVEILYEIEWEVLPVPIQKCIILLINRKQNVGGIKLGPFGTSLNRITFKIVCILLLIHLKPKFIFNKILNSIILVYNKDLHFHNVSAAISEISDATMKKP